MYDPRLTVDTDPRLSSAGDREWIDSTVAGARDFTNAEYFRDLADVFEPITVKSRFGADQGLVDHLRYPEPIPVHVRRITARYAADISPSVYEGAQDGSNVSSLESELCFPLGTVIAIEDKVRIRARGSVPPRWYTVTTNDDASTNAFMTVCRAVSTGVPDGVADDA